MTDTNMGVTCPSCGVGITVSNAGGYGVFCGGGGVESELVAKRFKMEHKKLDKSKKNVV
jgi:hypothetical protein